MHPQCSWVALRVSILHSRVNRHFFCRGAQTSVATSLAALPLAGHHEPRQRHGVTPLAAVRHDRPSGETSDARGRVSVTRVCSPAPPAGSAPTRSSTMVVAAGCSSAQRRTEWPVPELTADRRSVGAPARTTNPKRMHPFAIWRFCTASLFPSLVEGPCMCQDLVRITAEIDGVARMEMTGPHVAET